MVDGPLERLETQRAELFAQLAATGDLRRGSVNATYRRCGKPNCVCATEGHRGHGPRYLWTRSKDGKTAGRQLAAAEVDKVRRELANYQQFNRVSEAIIEVNEAICEARPPGGLAEEPTPAPEREKGGSGNSSRTRSQPS